MDFTAWCLVLAILCIGVSWSKDLSTLEEVLSLDPSFSSDASAQSNLLQPDLVDIDLTTRHKSEDNPDIRDIKEAALNPIAEREDSKIFRKFRRHKGTHERTEYNQNSAMTPVDARAIRWKPESAVLVKRCQLGLLSYGEPGTAWNETSCIFCECKSLNVECEKLQCPILTCKNQIQLDGECCPKCPEKLCETPDGRRFKHGAEWHMDDCTYCECNKGKVLCSVEDCQIPACSNPVKVPGRCCPTCSDTSCHASNGSHITSGEVWKESVCTHCYCAGGERKCAQEKCPFINCTARHTPRGKCCPKCDSGVVDCIVSDWGVWGDCPIQECGGGMTRRFRSVVVPHRNGGDFCLHMSEAKMCPRLPCDVLPVCPVTEWTPWGHCTATCGSGRKLRSRARTPTKATMTSLIDCSTTHFQETAHCYVGPCMSESAVFDSADTLIHDDICYQVTWSEWGPCSTTGCGSGVQKRHQELADSSHPRGHLCHLLDEYRTCQDQTCVGAEKEAVRCRVSPWGDWSPCSKTCGSGSRRTKHRIILQQQSGGGRACPRLSVTKQCRARACQAKSRIPESSCRTEDGRHYKHGDTWMEEPCTTYRCDGSQILRQKDECGPSEE